MTATANAIRFEYDHAGELVVVGMVDGAPRWFQLAKFREIASREVMEQVQEAFGRLPRSQQGIRVVVSSRTTGATWVAEVYDAMGNYRRDCMLADEGMDDAHRALAERGAATMAKRLDCPVVVVPLD